MFCENSLLIMVQAPQWQKRKQPPLRVGHPQDSCEGSTPSAMVFRQEKMGRGRRPRQSADPTVFLNVPHVENKYKLQDENGKILRIPENHIQEVCQFIHQYCPPGGWVLDPCAGSMATLLGAIFLNRNCIVNERDKVCYPLAVARAKLFLHFMMKTKGSQFPGLNVP